MNESEFQEIAEQTIADIQDAIDNIDSDIDYDEIGGVLTLEFENGSKVIFSKLCKSSPNVWRELASGKIFFEFYFIVFNNLFIGHYLSCPDFTWNRQLDS